MKINPKVYALFTKLAGDKLEVVRATAVTLAAETGKSPERALADALELYKLV